MNRPRRVRVEMECLHCLAPYVAWIQNPRDLRRAPQHCPVCRRLKRGVVDRKPYESLHHWKSGDVAYELEARATRPDICGHPFNPGLLVTPPGVFPQIRWCNVCNQQLRLAHPGDKPQVTTARAVVTWDRSNHKPGE